MTNLRHIALMGAIAAMPLTARLTVSPEAAERERQRRADERLDRDLSAVTGIPSAPAGTFDHEPRVESRQMRRARERALAKGR